MAEIKIENNFSQPNLSIPPDHKKPARIIFLVCFLIVAIAAAAGAYWYFSQPKTIKVNPLAYPVSGNPPLIQLSATTTPEGFPKDFSIAPDAQMMDSYNRYFDNNVIEADEIFSVPTNAGVVIQFYKNYLQTNGWEIIYEGAGVSQLKDLPRRMDIVAQKASDVARIVVYWNIDNPGTRFYITYYTKK